MSQHSDLYGDDIRLWAETQGALLRKLAAGEAVLDQVDWPNVLDEIVDVGHDPDQHEIARLTALLATAEARANGLRTRITELTSKLADTQAELATSQHEAAEATVRAAEAVEAEHAIRQSEAERRERGLWARLVAAWRGG